jgi:D-glycero-beta-D-manno-heptose-7-phosphate kinase
MKIMRASRFKTIVRNMAGKRIVVLGDLILDEYIFGETTRISREAPVMILKWRKRTAGFGGASNAVANVAAYGGVPLPVGCLGDDENGRTLLKMFEARGISAENVVTEGSTTTIAKTRIMAGGMHTMRQQIVRIDREPAALPDADRLIAAASAALAGADGMLVSDYGYGALCPKVVRYVNTTARKAEIPIAIDSRYRLQCFRNAALAAPNEEEAGIHAGYGADDIGKIEKTGEFLRKKLKSRGLLITRGSEGISLFEETKAPVHIPVFGSKAAVDTTGAGDTVVTAALLALCAGATYVEAAEIANRAGGLVVMKKGAETVSPAELLATL